MPAEQTPPAPGLRGLLCRITGVEPRELPAVITAFCLFFCVFFGYFAVRPVRETFGTVLGRDRVADLFVVTWIASIAIIPVYGFLVGKLRRSILLPLLYGAVAIALAIVGAVMQADPENVAVGRFFYVFISVLNLFVISVFWSFLLELFDRGQSKRLFPVVAAGGTAGALAGPGTTDLLVGTIGTSGILFLGAFVFGLTLVFQRILINIWKRGGTGQAASAETSGGGNVRGDRPIGGNPFAGFTKVLTTPYLLGIASFVVLLATLNTFLYFEQLRLVAETFSDNEARTRVFARIDWIVQGLTIGCQLFLTGRIASKLGLTVLLVIVPLVMIGGFLALAATGTFMVLVLVMIGRRVGEYAFVRPAREMLWSRLDNETRYKAKNVIDVPVYRGADAIAAQALRGLETSGFGAAAVAVLGAGLAGLWAFNGWWLGRKADKTDAAEAAALTPAPSRQS